MPCNKRHPGESRGPVYLRASGASWIPAFAGMTRTDSVPAMRVGPASHLRRWGGGLLRNVGGHTLLHPPCGQGDANLEACGAVNAFEDWNAAVAASVMGYNLRAAKGR